MTWFILTIISSFFAASFMELNRHLKLDGIQLNFWRMLVQVVILSPIFILFFDWPTNPYFYVVGAAGGVAFAVIDSYLWTISSHHNGRVASLFGPVQAVVAFSFWFLFSPQDLMAFLQQPLKVSMVLLAMGLIIGGSVSIKRNVIAWSIFKTMVLIGFIYGLLFIFRKLVIPAGEGALLEIAQIFVLHYIFGLILLAVILSVKFGRAAFGVEKKMLKASVIMAVLIFIPMVMMNLAVILAPNPGYPPAIYLVYPIWLLMYHRFVGIRDNASPIAGSAVVLGVIILLLAAV